MHSIDENETNVAQIMGFGIYALEETPESEEGKSSIDENSRLVAWGPLVDDNGDPVTADTEEGGQTIVGTAPKITGGSVPIFYETDFILLFGGATVTISNNEICLGALCADICTGVLNTVV